MINQSSKRKFGNSNFLVLFILYIISILNKSVSYDLSRKLITVLCWFIVLRNVFITLTSSVLRKLFLWYLQTNLKVF